MAYDSTRALTNAYAVTPSDTVEQTAFGFYVGVAGNVTIQPFYQGAGPPVATPAPVTFYNCPAGFLIRDIAIAKFMATGTTASDITALGPR